MSPSSSPSMSPTTSTPTNSPSMSPSSSPTNSPSKSKSPSNSPTMSPTTSTPTNSPSSPSMSPTTSTPTNSPSMSPSSSPSMSPTTSTPTNSPSKSKSPSVSPTASPSLLPSISSEPSYEYFPSSKPSTSSVPSRIPSVIPSTSRIPSAIPSTIPSSSSMPSSVPTDGIVFFLMQNQTAYFNVEETGCDPPRGNNAVSNVNQCRNGEGPVVYSFDNETAPLVVDGCKYTYIRYAPCLPDEAVTTAEVDLNTTVSCGGPPPVEDMTTKEFLEYVGEFIQTVIIQQKGNGVPVTGVEVLSICGRAVVSAGRMLAAETAHRRMQSGFGTALYEVSAKVTTECADSCVGVDFTAIENTLVSSISSATPDTTATGSVVSTELASTEPSAQPSVSSAPSLSTVPSLQPSANPSMNPSKS